MEARKNTRIPWVIVLLIVVLCCAIAYGAAVFSKNLSAENNFGRTTSINIANLQDLQSTSNGFVYYDGKRYEFFYKYLH